MTNIAEPHLGDYYLDDMSDRQLDGLLAFALNKSDLETARSLFSSKWWDYRFVHPGRCYMLFAHLYGEAVEQWRTMFGVNVYAKLKSVGHPIWRTEYEKRGNVESRAKPVLRPQAFRTGIWRAMCFADAHGIPYDRFIQLCFEFAFENQWQHLPLPTALYGTWMISAVLERWEEEKRNLIRLPKDPRFMASGYTGHPYQDEFQEWLLNLIAARPNPNLPLVQYLARERYLLLSKAVEKFGKERVKEAVLRASR